MNNKNKVQVEELSEDQIESVSAAGAPRKGVIACATPNGDVVARKPKGDLGDKSPAGLVSMGEGEQI